MAKTNTTQSSITTVGLFRQPQQFRPALIALGATIRLQGPSGVRDVPAEKFFVIPLNEQQRETAIQPNEILAEILIPTAPTANATYEVRHKEALDWPLATASVALKMSGNQITTARVVLGHVAPTPFAATAADKYLAGKPLNEQTAEEAAKQAVMSATPLSQNAYKVQLAKVAVKRAALSREARLKWHRNVPVWAGLAQIAARIYGGRAFLSKPSGTRLCNTATIGPSGASTPSTAWVRIARLPMSMNAIPPDLVISSYN